MNPPSCPQALTTALLGLSLLSSSAAASAPQSTGTSVFYRGLEHILLGNATAQTSGDQLVVSNIGSSGDDGVRVLITHADTFLSSAPLDPMTPVGASMMSEFRGTVGGVPNAPAGRLGFQRTTTGFLAIVDLSALGSPAYDIKIFADDALVHTNTGLTAYVIELSPSGHDDQECIYFPEYNKWVWIGPPIVYQDYEAGVVVTGDRLEISPFSPVPPTEGPRAVDVLGTGMPEMRIVDEALGKFHSLHRGDSGTRVATCIDCLVVSNIGASGDCPTGVTISNFGSSGDDGAAGAAAQTRVVNIEMISMDLTSSLLAGARLEFSSTARTDSSTEAELGTMSCVKIGPGAWDLDADFMPLGTDTYGVQFLLGGSAEGSLPVIPHPIRVAAPPTALAANGENWFDGLRLGYSARFDSPQLIVIPGAGSYVADEVRFFPMDSPAGPVPQVVAFLTARIDTDGIQSYTIVGESSLLADSYCTATANSTGQPAHIFGTGSSSVAANDLVLSAAPVPNQFGVFFYGPAQTAVPFGNGILCVGGEIHRLDVEVAMGNVLKHELDNTDPPGAHCQIFPGSTWNFEAWFRDPAGGGAAFNLSDGLGISFLP